MRTIFFFICLVFFGISHSISAPVSAVGIVKVYEIGEGNPMRKLDGRRYLLKYSVYIQNQGGEALDIPTSGFYSYDDCGPDKRIVSVEWVFSRTSDGSCIIPAKSSLGIVELKPGEVALVQWESVVIQPLVGRVVSIKITTEKEFAKRFGFHEFSLDLPNIQVVGP